MSGGLAALALGATLLAAPAPPAKPEVAPLATADTPFARSIAAPTATPRPPRPAKGQEGAEDPESARPLPRARPETGALGVTAVRDPSPDRTAPRMKPPTPQVVLDQQASRRPAETKLPVCRDPRIEGAMIPAIVHPSWPCGIAQPVRVNAIAGIRLSTPATLDCNTASRLATWLTGVVVPAARTHLGSGIDKVWLMGTYACRRRNNKPNGKLSEHARGRAVDVGGVWLRNGRQVSLQDGWGNGADGQFLAQIRGRACGLFHTVLGPGSDRYHDDHLHLDTSPRGGEPYCR